MAVDPFGRALRDHHKGSREEPLVQRDGDESLEHPIEEFYFGTRSPEAGTTGWFDSWIDGPLLDMGAGVGRDALYYQRRFETVAVEVSEPLVETMRERGVSDARRADMFDLRSTFERDRFRSALAYGTQLGLAGSMAGLRRFLGDLAVVTSRDGTAVLDGYDPTDEGAADLLGYREDPTPGLAHRVMHFEYAGEVGRALLFRLFSPDRLREATIGTPWEVSEVNRGSGGRSYHYQAALSKPSCGRIDGT